MERSPGVDVQQPVGDPSPRRHRDHQSEADKQRKPVDRMRPCDLRMVRVHLIEHSNELVTRAERFKVAARRLEVRPPWE